MTRLPVNLTPMRAVSGAAVSFAELGRLDVGMCDIGVGRRRVRIDSRNLVGLVFVQASQIEDNLETSQFDPFQRYLFGDNRNRVSLKTAFNVAELLPQRDEVAIDLAR